MDIAIIGTGYVGLVTGTCFAEMGNNVYCVDIDVAKISTLKKGNVPIFEPGLEQMVQKNLKQGSLKVTTDLEEALNVCNICFIAVGTPMDANGRANLQYVLKVAEGIGKYMHQHMYVVDKSTVPVGTFKLVRQTIQAELEKRKAKLTFDVISNPEFLKEGAAIADCMRPDRIVIGMDNMEALKVMRELYLPYVKNTENFIWMDIASAEMTKYAANAMLATKISFMNEIANICERVGADVNKVRLGIGSDSRIGYSFIYAGCGYGGSCFPKDIEALIKTSDKFNYDCQLLQAVEAVNERQKHVLVEKVVKRFGDKLRGKTFAVWGLAFKPDTDDMRAATSIVVINELTKRGAVVKVYDPKAMHEAEEHYLRDNDSVQYCENKYDALDDADALILITEWKEFRSPDFSEIKQRLKAPIIFDGRNQYESEAMKTNGFEYYQIGVGDKQ
jgi:UDPglucose 6-dehydrogenase